MTPTNRHVPKVRQLRADRPTHRYAAGQIVILKENGVRKLQPGLAFRIVAALPPRGTAPQYRIRNDEERHERMATQDELELASMTLSSGSLLERTFSHGQRPETQHARNQEAEAAQKGF
jgi:hypothetical protein